MNESYYNSITTQNRQTVENTHFLNDWGSRGREFKSRHSDQDVLMKDATQKTPHESAVFLYLYRLFSGGKVRKNAFSGNQFFYARGDILEMQQSTLADWCDLNTKAKKE